MNAATNIVLNGEMTIGLIVTTYPETRSIIEKYFHGGCHHCPSQHVEPLWLAARMYGLQLDALIHEMQDVIEMHSSDSDRERVDTLVPASPTERRLARDRARGLVY